MIRFEKVFRVRVTVIQDKQIAKALKVWKVTHHWERTGVFYRRLLDLGLEHVNKGI